MNEKRAKRKLTAILSADVVGCSLISADGAPTIKTLNTYGEIMASDIYTNPPKNKLD